MGAGDLEQTVTIRIKADGTAELVKTGQAFDSLGEQAKGAGKKATEGLSGFSDLAGEIKKALTDLAAPIIAAVASVEGLKRAIGNADYARDLAAQMRSVTGSTEDAAKAMSFFEESAGKTRETADDLSKTFAELFTLAKKRGFTQDMFQDVTVQLAQFAAATGKTTEEITENFRQILSGTPRAQGNTILTRLGLTPTEVTNGVEGARKVMEGIKAVAAEGEKAGQTFESTGKKLMDSFLTAFARGFNSARGDVDKGLQGLIDAFNGPQVQEAIKSIGKAFAEVAPIVLGVLQELTKGVTAVFGAAEITAGSFLQGLAKLGSITPGLKNMEWVKDLQTLGTSLQGSGLGYLKQTFADVVSGSEAAATGLEKTSKAAKEGQPDFSGFAEKVDLAVKALLGIDEASKVARAALESAFSAVQKSQGTDAAVRLFGDQLIKLGDIARDTGQKLSKALQADIVKAQAA